MYDVSDLRKGIKLLIDGAPWVVTDFEFSKPGKGQAIYNCKLKNMLNGTTMSRSYRSNDKFEKPDLSQRLVHFSYAVGDSYFFTDENYEQVEMSAETLGRDRFFLIEDMECEVLYFSDEPIEVTLPNFVERKIIHCDPGARGNTAAGKVTKPATIEGDYELPVPLFVNEGDTIRVDTRNGEYVDRVRS
ncbi:MAG: elongation factor P [Lentisphaerae bacterium]|nr:elongation factor P [Lentisphaerota bacterium]